MLKLFVVSLLLFLAAVPPALASTGIRLSGPIDRAVPAGEDTPPLDLFEEHIDRRRAEARREARERRRRKARRAAAVAVPPHLQAIAACESGGNPRAISANGTYRGKYQFSVETWQGVGGKGDPAAAPEAEQDRRAAMLYARSGPGQWPVCGA